MPIIFVFFCFQEPKHQHVQTIKQSDLELIIRYETASAKLQGDFFHTYQGKSVVGAIQDDGMEDLYFLQSLMLNGKTFYFGNNFFKHCFARLTPAHAQFARTENGWFYVTISGSDGISGYSLLLVSDGSSMIDYFCSPMGEGNFFLPDSCNPD
ncbi:MAG: hypothetical protein H6510_09455 [Acidobacteria bacterium]|nr:hypothetical protein [Acidobacteriota bacterium]